jgi:putative Mn2+ efflux pump MntP
VLGRPLLGSAAVIGVVAGLMTLVGLQSARVLRLWVGKRMETVGGVVLVGLAFRMLLI